MCLEGFLGEKNSSIGHSSLQYPPQWFTSAYMGSPPPTRYHLVGQLTTATPTTRSTCTPSSWSRCPHIQWSVGHFVTSKKLWKILVRISPQDFPHTRRPWGNCRRRSHLGWHDGALIGHHIYMTEQSHGSFTWWIKSVTNRYVTINYVKSSFMTLYLHKKHLQDGSLV